MASSFNKPSFICNDFNRYSNCTSLCISNDNTIYSFGNSKYDSHGHIDELIKVPRQINNLTNIKMIAGGIFHTLCLAYDEKVFSFGVNSFGQLGLGKTKSELYKTNIPMYIDLPPIKLISCGTEFSICLSEDGNLYSFGNNKYGQLGQDNNECYISPHIISDINNISFVECGGTHVICKTFDYKFYSFGCNSKGQLGQGNYTATCTKPIQCLNWPDDIIDIKCGSHHSLLLTLEGYIYAFGSNYYGKLGINDNTITQINIPTLIKNIPEIQRIECGSFHSLCIDVDFNLWIFGRNENGQLGLGEKTNIYKPLLHPILNNIIDVSSGGEHTFVKTLDNKIYAFGRNEYSQLGIKTSNSIQYEPIQVFIDSEDIWCSFIGRSKAKSARK